MFSSCLYNHYIYFLRDLNESLIFHDVKVFKHKNQRNIDRYYNRPCIENRKKYVMKCKSSHIKQ